MITCDVRHQNSCKGIDISALLSIGLSRSNVRLSIISSIKPLLSMVKVGKFQDSTTFHPLNVFVFYSEKVATLSAK